MAMSVEGAANVLIDWIEDNPKRVGSLPKRKRALDILNEIRKEFWEEEGGRPNRPDWVDDFINPKM